MSAQSPLFAASFAPQVLREASSVPVVEVSAPVRDFAPDRRGTAP